MSDTRPTSRATFHADVLSCPLPALVYYSAPWCGPCKKFAPVLEQVAAGAAGTMVVFKVDIDVHPDLAQEYNVMSVPAVHVFNGGQLLAVLSGPRSKPTLLAAIAAVLG